MNVLKCSVKWNMGVSVNVTQVQRQKFEMHPSIFTEGEGNGTPLQCSCLENPMDGGAWWAAVHGSLRVRHD